VKYKRTIATAIALCSGVCALGSVVTDAQAASGPRPERCTNDGYGRVSKMFVAKGTTCGTAYKVLDRWMANDGLEGTVRLRVGRDGVLWKCYGYRAYGKLNPWYVSCTSSQGRWVNNRYGGFMNYRSTWFEYRND
jgi:hypothetical protein